ncbi:MAG: prepilin-type N-terminal cleavage/methylation domain-containing protein [Candidatus Zixiibacteriota bacterium]|nr:MAG: prepilin-type N-terminal cleavage/methylation domain-containing protein [candidate division Zixibacteria bacterium]
MKLVYAFNKHGVTLLEVMISLIVLSIGLLGLAPFVVLSIESNNISKDALVASNIVRNKIEYLESLDSIPSAAYSEYEPDVETGYNRTTTILDNSSDPTIPEGLLRASVAADWIDKTGMSRQVIMSTYLQKSE